MQQHVAIAMADHLPIMGNINSPQSQWSAVPQPVGVMANPDPQSVRGFSPFPSPLAVQAILGSRWMARIIGENGEAGKFTAKPALFFETYLGHDCGD